MGDGSAETRRSAAAKSLWGRVYRARMRAGLEVCRRCGDRDRQDCPLTFDHIVAVSEDGPGDITNVTILCLLCNHEKDRQWWSGARSLKEEEDHAPAHQQWSKLAYADLYTRRYECAECGGWSIATTNRRISVHPTADGLERCPGSHRRVTDDSVAAVLEYSLRVAGEQVAPNWSPVPEPPAAFDPPTPARPERPVVWSSG